MTGSTDDPDRTRVALVDPLVGKVIASHYRIEIGLAAGGFGTIYRALDLRDDRDVALKLVHPDHAQNPQVVARFRREGRALQQLRDPHTVKAHEVGETDDGTLYIAMELLAGENLYETFQQLGPLPWRRVAAIARAVCSSLAEAHALGIVHRDLKPANIFLQEGIPVVGDAVKVLDFGIAKIVRGDSGLDTSDLTHVGHMIGTFDYMAPEQMVGGECTGQTDLFTLGVVMYEMISGARPFGEHRSSAAMLAALLGRTPEPLGAFVEVPPELDRIVQRCIAKDRARRYPTIDELATDLDVLLAPDDDLAGTVTVISRADLLDEITPVAPPDVAVDPEETATQFAPPPVFEPAAPKFRPATTVPGIIAPKTKR